MAVELLHSQLRGPRERPLLPFRVSLFHRVASFSAPTVLATHPLSTGLSRAPKRSAHGQPGGCCVSPRAQWKDCRRADVTSARRTRLVLLQGGILSNRNKHPLCWAQTRQGPSEGSAPLAPVLLPGEPPLPGLRDPPRDETLGAGGLGRREPSYVRGPFSCLPSPRRALPSAGPGTWIPLCLSSCGLALGAAGVLACSDQAEEESQP